MCLEYILLAICLCVIALRTTFTESPTVQATTFAGDISNNLYSMSISTILIFSFVLWVVWSFCGKRFVYRLSGIEIGLGIFCIAAVAAGIAAADKRLAITDFVMLVAPVLMALLLVQILDCQSKVKLVLAVIVALGVVSAYRCWEQYPENEHLIEFYEQDPNAALAQQRIVPNSLEHFQFEHRLYSKDISGFFTTSNSAGSFALLASLAAIALLIERYRNRKSAELEFVWLITCGIAVAVVIFGLVITKSKGAILASLFAAAMFVIYLCLGNRLKAHKKTVLIICLLLALAGTGAVVWYGLSHGRLPGGNSMLVRWQYWRASVKMYADHLLTGVGPGNFAHFYPHYKPASASESVANPHNFVLSILTQYGPIGLIGFLAMICMPLWAVVSPRSASCSSEAHRPEPTFKRLAIVLAIIVSAALLFIRPIIFPLPLTASPQERQAGIIILYIMPVIVFIAGFLLAAAGERPAKRSHSSIAAAALFCAVLGVGFHNLIDFAIFEPGVLTVFWAIIACLIAICSQTNPRPQVVLQPAPFVKILIVAAGVVITCVYFNYALVPVAKATAKIQRANRAISVGRFEQAHTLLDYAAEDDLLSPTALSLNGRLYLHHFERLIPRAPLGDALRRNRDLLLQAEKCLRAAIERNSAAFKNYERLTEAYLLLAKVSTQQEKIDWLKKAFDNASFTVEHRYPGCARLRIELAKIAEMLGRTDIASRQYEEAINIEDKYRAQFRKMYPEREKIVSRLGEEKYQFAKQRLKFLTGQSTP
ncbi:MAG: O-antigen ligase family protein [Planctomycetes bacterium]|nr:O-antigen ligase family protein [Planctomycetota bacterium]